jgi:LacI family transcriptional regulator
MKTTSAPTLHDVARHAGVSTATVSRALNEPERVTEKTREKVLRVVEQLGYTPHFGGRALVSNRSNTMGAVIPTMDNAIFARGIQAFQETLAKAGVTLLVASSSYDPERELDQIRALVSRGTDALMLIGTERPAESYAMLNRRRIPYVLAWSYQADADECFVGFDNRAAAAAMAREVLARGHRRIGMIAGITAANDRAHDRVEGVRAAVQAAPFSGPDMPIVEAVYSLDGGAQAMEKLLARDPSITAVLCGNDVLAVGAIQHAKAQRLNVPGDISITGFDDIELASVVDPGLTTVHVPHTRMGEAAANALLSMRDGSHNVGAVKLETHVIVRASLGPPRGHAVVW